MIAHESRTFTIGAASTRTFTVDLPGTVALGDRLVGHMYISGKN